MPEAPLEDSGSGLAPAGDGWFVVNVRDAAVVDVGERRKAAVRLGVLLREPEVPSSRSSGIRLHVLEPGEPNGLYHSESQQEAFLVLSGECTLLVEGVERLLRPWDFFHSPAGTEHIFVGAGDGPCVILMAGCAIGGLAGALPGIGARGALRRERGGGDVRPGAGVRAVRAVTAGAALVLGPPPLGLAPEHAFDRMNAPGRYIWRGDVEPASRVEAAGIEPAKRSARMTV